MATRHRYKSPKVTEPVGELPRVVLTPEARRNVDRLLTGSALILSLHGLAFAAGRIWDALKDRRPHS